MPELKESKKEKAAPAKAEAVSSSPKPVEDGAQGLTKGQKIFVVFAYIIGLAAALTVIFLGEHFHWW